MSRVATLAVLALLAGAPARAQITYGYDYEARYGRPVDVSITDLVQTPDAYHDRAVRTRGRLGLGSSGFRDFLLQESLALGLRLVPMPELAASFESEALNMIGQELEVTGVFLMGSGEVTGASTGPVGTLRFWSFLGPPEREGRAPLEALETSLEALVTNPGRRDGQTVRVVGEFRGRNLFGDLPVKSQRDSRDWVIKNDLFAVWVTGRKPKGEGWELDAKLKRDTGKWVEVIGRPDTRGGVTYLRAIRLSLTTAPSAAAEAKPPPPPPAKPKRPPVVVFALPLDGDGQVAPDARFHVQFSKDMDRTSFQGRVVLRYVGPPRPGDRGFHAVKISYDDGRRALTVDPGDLLRPGRELELLLLPGIADIEGLPLEPRQEQASSGVVDVLRYRIGG